MKRISFLISLLLVTALNADAQYTDTIIRYYDFDWNIVDPAKEIYYYFGTAKKTTEGTWHSRDYYADTKTLQMEGMYLDDSLTIQDGQFYYYHKNGQLSSEGSYYRNNLVGLWREYNERGMLIDSARFKSTGLPFHKAYSWDDDGRLIFYGEYNMQGTGEGYETVYYEDGTISSFGKYTVGYVPDSSWIYFDENGATTAIEIFDSGKLVSYTCYYPNGAIQKKDCDTGFVFPKFDFDINMYIRNNVRGLRDLQEFLEIKKTIKRDIYVQISIDRKGFISCEILTECHPLLKKFLTDMFKSIPRSEPVMYKNRPVAYSDIDYIPFSPQR